VIEESIIPLSFTPPVGVHGQALTPLLPPQTNPKRKKKKKTKREGRLEKANFSKQ